MASPTAPVDYDFDQMTLETSAEDQDCCLPSGFDPLHPNPSGLALYGSANRTGSPTDALAVASSRFIGFAQDVAGQLRVSGIEEAAQFTTAGGSPSAGAPVYLALSTADGGTGAGKLTATPPSSSGEVIAEVGICISNANYAGLKTCQVLIQVKAPILIP